MVSLQTGPQREIFPGGTKIDAGPPKLGEELKCIPTKFEVSTPSRFQDIAIQN